MADKKTTCFFDQRIHATHVMGIAPKLFLIPIFAGIICGLFFFNPMK
jgi:hypothetical protein